jgi:hypothetical protein
VDENYCCEVHLQKLKRSDRRAADTGAIFNRRKKWVLDYNVVIMAKTVLVR